MLKEISDGKYKCMIERLEIDSSKDGRPMFKSRFRILEGENKGLCIYSNKVLAGTRNNASMIISMLNLLRGIKENLVIFTGDFDVLAEDIKRLSYYLRYNAIVNLYYFNGKYDNIMILETVGGSELLDKFTPDYHGVKV